VTGLSVWFFLISAVDDMDVEISSPEERGGSSSAPTVPGPTLDDDQIKALIIEKTSTQEESLFLQEKVSSRAFSWLKDSSFNSKYFNRPNKLVQRYALAALFYSLNGEEWGNNEGWLSDEDECDWYFSKRACDEDGVVTVLDLNDNMLVGSIPSELGALGQLTFLDMSGNQLFDYLPPVEVASSLKELRVNDNQINAMIDLNIDVFSNLGTFLFFDNFPPCICV